MIYRWLFFYFSGATAAAAAAAAAAAGTEGFGVPDEMDDHDMGRLQGNLLFKRRRKHKNTVWWGCKQGWRSLKNKTEKAFSRNGWQMLLFYDCQMKKYDNRLKISWQTVLEIVPKVVLETVHEIDQSQNCPWKVDLGDNRQNKLRAAEQQIIFYLFFSAMLEARGFPPHLAGVLGPRMHHLILNRAMAPSATTKAQQLLQVKTCHCFIYTWGVWILRWFCSLICNRNLQADLFQSSTFLVWVLSRGMQMYLMKIFKMVFSDFISRVLIKARSMPIGCQCHPKCLKVFLFGNDRTNWIVPERMRKFWEKNLQRLHGIVRLPSVRRSKMAKKPFHICIFWWN